MKYLSLRNLNEIFPLSNYSTLHQTEAFEISYFLVYHMSIYVFINQYASFSRASLYHPLSNLEKDSSDESHLFNGSDYWLCNGLSGTHIHDSGLTKNSIILISL